MRKGNGWGRGPHAQHRLSPSGGWAAPLLYFFVQVFLRFRRAPFFTKIFWWNNTTAKMLLDAAKEDESSGRTLVAFGRIYQAQLKYG